MAVPAHDPRSVAQSAHEDAMRQVSDVVLNIDQAITRARKGLKRIGDADEEGNTRLALADALKGLQDVKARLQKDAYYSGSDLRLI